LSTTAHTHDERYYTETETDLLLAGKSSSAHIHDGFYVPTSGGTFTGDFTLDGSLSANSISGNINAVDGFVFAVRADDPATPIQGQA